MKVSLIISTYNWPNALELVLRSVTQQTRMPDEVIIADDGSTDETRALIADFTNRLSCAVDHIWHADEGFRLSMIRNKAIAKSRGDYLIMIDGDCVLRPDFIERHIELSRPNCFVAGNRVLLTEQFTKKVFAEKLAIEKWSAFQFNKTQINRRWSLLGLPLLFLVRRYSKRWQGVKTCNLSMYKKDFLEVNGFDEAFVGWGYEDSDLVVRLLRKGMQRISGRFHATVLHLWHASSATHQKKDNWQRFQKTLHGDNIQSALGVNRF